MPGLHRGSAVFDSFDLEKLPSSEVDDAVYTLVDSLVPAKGSLLVLVVGR